MAGMKPGAQDLNAKQEDSVQKFHEQVQSHCNKILYFTEQIRQTNEEVHKNRYVGNKEQLLNELEQSIFIYKKKPRNADGGFNSKTTANYKPFKF